MCGICGVVDGRGSEDGAWGVGRMMDAMRHRGPDDQGTHTAPGVILGMCRLSIIDLEGGRQPMANEDGRVVVVQNGEIYNFHELRRDLTARGHVFRTESDTEVIAHAYEEWGADCVHRLRGMFAFAVHDSRPTGRLSSGHAAVPGSGTRVFLARDRFGIKPLYYYHAAGRLAFASEVRALLASGCVPRRLSPAGLRHYLLFGSAGEPTTLVEGVYSLPPGHRMLVEVGELQRSVSPQCYWDVLNAAGDGEAGEESVERGGAGAARADVVARIRSILEESVRLHLIADVPLGIFLSSGIDSTALGALAARHSSQVRTLTVAFPELEFSESRLASQTARVLGTTHQELVLDADEMLSRLDAAVAALDQPSMDGVNTYFVSWMARQAGLKVALSGLGGDELFGGYPTFRWTLQLDRLARFRRAVPAVAQPAVGHILAAAGGRIGARGSGRKLAEFWSEPQALPHPYFFNRLVFTPRQAVRWLGQADGETLLWWEWLAGAAKAVQRAGLDAFTTVSYLESRSYLVNTLLRDTDSMSMGHSLEVRVPFLDHELAEFMARAPGRRLWTRRAAGKSLLIEALRDILPRDVVRQRKRGFNLPWERWLRGRLRGSVEAGLHDPPAAVTELLDAGAAPWVWRAFLGGRTGWSRPWSLYVLNAWTRLHLEAAPASGAGHFYGGVRGTASQGHAGVSTG
ncbi:MAG: asparagine synthase (glutamine-hydrolyzing) [Gemmatimonadetes bacterium]|nr:asparagine synthase (glutamine-hydrolyzing) [Gemmatimonadota bacterium]